MFLSDGEKHKLRRRAFFDNVKLAGVAIFAPIAIAFVDMHIFWPIWLGAFCNAIAVFGNGGKMPVMIEALRRVRTAYGRELDIRECDEEILGEHCFTHSVARSPPRFALLVDRFYFPLRHRDAIFSMGDIFMDIGRTVIFIYVVRWMCLSIIQISETLA